MDRRKFVQWSAGASIASIVARPVMAGPFNSADLDPRHPVPLDKKLRPDWVQSLYARGEPTTYRGWDNLKFIGMPVGGIGAGTVYLGGDGKLWCFDIFNQHHMGCVPNKIPAGEYQSLFGRDLNEIDGTNYVKPSPQQSPWNFEQGFGIRLRGEEKMRNLDHTGFADVSFRGQYPVGTVEYADPSCPLTARLEAFSPFVPLDADRSSWPAVVMSYTFKNTGDKPVEFEAFGWTENPALRRNFRLPGATRACRVISGGGNTGLDMTVKAPLKSLPDFGSVALVLVGDGVARPGTMWGEEKRTEITAPVFQHLMGSVSRALTLAPGAEATATFILAWHFPNTRIPGFPNAKTHRWYGTKWKDAKEVALALAADLPELTRITRLWRDTYYGGTLPHWFLERCLATLDTLQTTTCHRFADGRFWAWEGVGCCHGTCTHVWHYAQSCARLFPSLERDLRERTDFGIAFRESDGMIKFRGEFEKGPATDGQAGIILRTLREHQMSADDSFLKSVWPKCKLALQFLIDADAKDGSAADADGIQAGDQPNTLDASWFGKIPSLSSLYLAALRAGEEMATEMGDAEFASRCRGIYDKGRENILQLFDEKLGYFFQEEDPLHPEAVSVGRGCFIDQVIGQWWAGQVGLGRLFDRDKVRAALGRLWDYNFCPDMGLVRNSIKRLSQRGRLYALEGDAGLVMCTWPFGGRPSELSPHWQIGYFNECMSGFEHQAAGHMIWEGGEEMVQHGLAIVRAVHDRYHARARNPFNEIECSDHYTRAMASYGAFIAACGFECHGPKGRIAFAPRIGAHDFRAAFTTAAGFGSFAQKSTGGKMDCAIELAHGTLKLKTVGLAAAAGFAADAVVVTAPDGAARAASFRQDGERVEVELAEPVTLTAGQTLKVSLSLHK